MPRREEGRPSLEERMMRAATLAWIKRKRERQLFNKLYTSRLYRYARRSCVFFLWIAQLLMIDWLLPYIEERDNISGGYFNANTMRTGNPGGITDYRLSELFIRTQKGYRFTLDFTDSDKEPSVGDTVVLLKSFLLHDYKKVTAPRIKESYFVSSSVTYRYLPFLMIISGIALMFIFVRDIEVKAFAWIALILTAGFSIFAIGYMVMTAQ